MAVYLRHHFVRRLQRLLPATEMARYNRHVLEQLDANGERPRLVGEHAQNARRPAVEAATRRRGARRSPAGGTVMTRKRARVPVPTVASLSRPRSRARGAGDADIRAAVDRATTIR